MNFPNFSKIYNFEEKAIGFIYKLFISRIFITLTVLLLGIVLGFYFYGYLNETQDLSERTVEEVNASLNRKDDQIQARRERIWELEEQIVELQAERELLNQRLREEIREDELID